MAIPHALCSFLSFVGLSGHSYEAKIPTFPLLKAPEIWFVTNKHSEIPKMITIYQGTRKDH